ncbi:hypothetical protein F2Q69_00047269 [Brassica cretica]|uniref:Uncharacterized protein n=1 Tax=Brassica cretica TaxID=69181 RepID=A0A8S9PWK6_BRACR|nr:hypothetical protein F2Q69_00047269 [Brassica cretica]
MKLIMKKEKCRKKNITSWGIHVLAEEFQKAIARRHKSFRQERLWKNFGGGISEVAMSSMTKSASLAMLQVTVAVLVHLFSH